MAVDKIVSKLIDHRVKIVPDVCVVRALLGTTFRDQRRLVGSRTRSDKSNLLEFLAGRRGRTRFRPILREVALGQHVGGKRNVIVFLGHLSEHTHTTRKTQHKLIN